MDILKDLNNTVEQLKKASNVMLGEVMKPEIMALMTDEQKRIVNGGRNAFVMGDLSPDEKMNELQKLMKDVANSNK